MDINIVTIHYHPISFLKESLKNNYSLFKKEKIKFNHYLVDNKFPLEREEQNKIKDICNDYNIKYLTAEKNLGLMMGKKFFHETIKARDIILQIESDVYLLTENLLTTAYEINKNNDVKNVIYLNNKNLNDYNKNIFTINDINVFELDIKELNHTWIQCCFYNNNHREKIQKIIDEKKENNYDFPGESSDAFKKENIPFLILNDHYEDMERYRFQNYFEYEYYKSLVYYWSKFENEFKNLTFENFIENYDYYFEMKEKFAGCYKNFKNRAKDYVFRPNFYFEKTKIKFNELNTKNIIINNAKNGNRKKTYLKTINKIL